MDYMEIILGMVALGFLGGFVLGWCWGHAAGETETARWYERRAKAADIEGDAVVSVVGRAAK